MHPLRHVDFSRRLIFATLAAVTTGLSTSHASDAPPTRSSTAANAIMTRLTKAEKKAEDAKGEDAVSRAFQELAFTRSLVGDYTGAIAAFRKGSGGRSTARAVEADEVKRVLEGYRAIPALDAIVQEAKGRQIVILNEAHHIARHRLFAQMLATRLRAIGFEYLACETFSSPTTGLAQRGYPTFTDGYYTGEPLFADFVRQSLKLSYIPVAYETERHTRTPNQSPSDSINERETDQATHLVERILGKNPKARVFIYVGYSHLLKKEVTRGGEDGKKVQWMAGRLKAMTGIDPLTIDQTAMTDPAPGSLESAILQEVFSAATDPGAAAVLQREDSAAYLVRGNYAGDAEMQVCHRLTKLVQGRPDWLGLNGYRKPQDIPTDLLPKTGRRLIKAMVEGEGDGVIAMDQVIVEAGSETPPVLMLPAGRFKFAYEE